MEELFDVVVIGGGPAGLTAAQYASRSGLRTIVLDRSPDAGALAYSKKIENYPGILEPLTGKQFLENLRNQAVSFGAEYVETQVSGVDLDNEVKEVYGTDNAYKGKTVIIATGSMGRKPGIPGEEGFIGRGVSYCATCDAPFFKDMAVSVVGDSEEALKEAAVLSRFAKEVHVIIPAKNPSFSMDRKTVPSEKLHVHTGSRVVMIKGNDVVTQITVKESESGKERDMPMDGVFVYLSGNRPVVDFLNTSIELSETSCVLTHRTAATSIPGVFAAGDVTCGEIRQVVVAAGFGCIAALSAEKFIHQRKRSRFDWGERKGD